MRNSFYRRFFLALTLIVWFQSVFADDYYWRASIQVPIPNSSTPSALCTSWADYLNTRPHYPGFSSYVLSAVYSTPSQFFCRGTFNNGNENVPYSPGYALRVGDTCPHPTDTYNPQTGACDPAPEPEPNKCESGAGATSRFNSSGTSGDGKFSLAGSFVVGPNEMCFDGCSVVVTGLNGRFRTDGSYRVWGNKTKTGAECGPGGAALANGDPDPKPPEVPPIDVQQKPCVYTTNPDGTQSCQSEKSIDKQGHYCGQFQGEEKCVTSPASKNGISISTNVTKSTDPSGTSKIVKTDVTTKTSCTPVNKCSNSSTTRTTTTTVGSDGKVISVIGACSGKDCSDKNDDPDGNGSGAGDCTGVACGDPFGGSLGSDGFYEPGEDTFESVLTAFQAGVKQIPVVQGASNFLAFSPSGSCPSGSVNVMGMHIQLDQWCGSSIPWPFIAAVVLGIAAILSYRIAFM